jgi:tetratricopeptide (TPR) repeat protein
MKTAPWLVCAIVLLIGCDRREAAPDAATPASAPADAQPLFEGLGGVHFPVTTSSPEAQRYLDQGLALAYGFNHGAADRAFTEAAMRDPDCAMCYWGSAMVLGPNLNAPMDDANVARARVLAAKALALAEKATPKERALANAMVTRYGPEGTTPDRAALDAAYADAMRAIAAEYPDDDDVLALTAESLMDLHPWNFWLADGTAQPWTAEVVSTIEKALAVNPDHIGAIHFYIHAVEQSQDAGRAAAYADRLAGLAPTAGHLVHMPAHIYIRVGRYHDSTLNNIEATQSDSGFLVACGSALDVYKVGYVPHNWHFGWITAAIEGWSAKAVELAVGTASLIPEDMMRAPGLSVTQHFYMQPAFAYLRFGRWDDVLAIQEPAADLIYARAIWHYAQGEAQLGKGNVDAAVSHLATLKSLRADPAMSSMVFFGINSAIAVSAVAEAFLAADIERAKGNLEAAIDGFETALDLESELNYTEPPDWFFPVRHALGDAQLAAGDFAAAERTFSDDLAVYPENGWSLFGLAKALRAQGKEAEAAAVDGRFAAAWAHADIQLTGTRL